SRSRPDTCIPSAPGLGLSLVSMNTRISSALSVACLSRMSIRRYSLASKVHLSLGPAPAASSTSTAQPTTSLEMPSVVTSGLCVPCTRSAAPSRAAPDPVEAEPVERSGLGPHAARTETPAIRIKADRTICSSVPLTDCGAQLFGLARSRTEHPLGFQLGNLAGIDAEPVAQHVGGVSAQCRRSLDAHHLPVHPHRP